jgi:hypothetical protein
MSKGIIYAATGEQFVREAVISAQSVREIHPDMSITLFSDVGSDHTVFDSIITLDEPEYGFGDKITALPKTPYDRTLFLDTDIYVCEDISSIFDLLDRFDLAAAHNHNREAPEAAELNDVPDSFPEYNTGVLLYNDTADSMELLRAWKQHYLRRRKQDPHDQPSFRQALYESDIRFATLTPEFNCMVRYPGHVRNRVRMCHARLLDIQTPGSNISINVPKAAETLNAHDTHRLFVPNGSDGVRIIWGQDTLARAAFREARMRGIRHATRRVFKFVFTQLLGRGSTSSDKNR